MAQREDNMVCGICGKPNPAKHQDFCVDLECSGRMVLIYKKGAAKCTCGAGDGSASHLIGCPFPVPPGGIRYFDKEDLFPGPVQRREGVKYITSLPEGEPCVGMLMFKDTMYVATGKGVYKMVGDKLEAVQFVVKED